MKVVVVVVVVVVVEVVVEEDPGRSWGKRLKKETRSGPARQKSPAEDLSLSVIFSFLLSSRMRTCTQSTAPRVSPSPSGGCQQVLACRGGLARSVVAVFVARCSVCLETRGKPEWALSGLRLWNWIMSMYKSKGRPGLRDNIQTVLIFATKLVFRESYAI